MKLSRLIALPLCFVAISSYANTLSPKHVMLPFSNIPLISDDYTGLEFHYDMNGNPSRKIICELSNIYKSWIEFKDDGSLRESGTFGTNHSVTFTNKGQTAEVDDNRSIYHADAIGKIRINEVDLGIDDDDNDINQGTASCYYTAE